MRVYDGLNACLHVCMDGWMHECNYPQARAITQKQTHTRAHTRALSHTHTATVDQQDPRIIGTLQYYQRNRMRTAILLTKLTTDANGRTHSTQLCRRHLRPFLIFRCTFAATTFPEAGQAAPGRSARAARLPSVPYDYHTSARSARSKSILLEERDQRQSVTAV